MVGQLDAMAGRDFTLTRFNRFVAELDNLAAIQADQVIVVMLLRQFEDRLAAFKVVTSHNTGIIKLVQNTVNGRQANLFANVDQAFIQIFRTDVMALRFLKHFQNFQSGQRYFQASLL
ncbi:Uncharacterised protein [Pantoea agglomerans]|uniref:Uncharacterized protein n=1 Tax=Enterobacter agglomerans TaxID=549 RepID=A0A379AJ73_ENTAG|nr:Uncharacterised protein [Pantoea agglomerans]